MFMNILLPGVSSIFIPSYSRAKTEVATRIPFFRSISIESLAVFFFTLLSFTAPAF